MIAVLLVRNLGAAFNETFQRERQIMSMNHPFQKLLLMQFIQHLKQSDKSLLSRCLHGGTQNQNEAINALIWQRATKETHASTPTVELATFLAVSHFNDGSQTLLTTLEALGIDPGYHCRKACMKLDHNRIRHSRRKSGEASKKRRRQLQNYKKGFTETLEAREGPSYGPGAF